MVVWLSPLEATVDTLHALLSSSARHLDRQRGHQPKAPLSEGEPIATIVMTETLPLTEFVAGLVWIKEHQLSLMGAALRTRMTVLRLDGGLCLHSPVVIDDATRHAIERLGKVIALVAPSNCHHLYFASAQRAFPHARTFGTVDVQRKRQDLKFDEIIGDAAPSCWAGQMDQVFVGNRIMREVVFLHRASRTLIAVDLVENFSSQTAGTNRVLWAMMKVLRMWGRPRPAPELRLFTLDREAARSAIAQILAWDFDRAVIAHGDLLNQSPHAAIREAWQWVLQP
jgi:hypothetical protein